MPSMPEPYRAVVIEDDPDIRGLVRPPWNRGTGAPDDDSESGRGLALI